MLVLGIDPGARVTGFGAVRVERASGSYVDAGVIRLPSRRSLSERLHCLHRELSEVITRIAPDAMAVESLFHARSPRTGIVLGHARGVILLAAAQAGVPVAEYAPSEIKQAVTGRGLSPKPQVLAMLQRLIGAPESTSLDASDALAVALCHVHRVRVRGVAGVKSA